MNFKGRIIDKITVFKRKSSIFLDKLRRVIKKTHIAYIKKAKIYEKWENELINNVLDIIAIIKDVVGLKIENYRINKIVKLQVRIGKIKNKIGYQ